MSLLTVVLIVFIAALAGVLWGPGPALMGAALGYVIGTVQSLAARIIQVERRQEVMASGYKKRLSVLEEGLRHQAAQLAAAASTPGVADESAIAEDQPAAPVQQPHPIEALPKVVSQRASVALESAPQDPWRSAPATATHKPEAARTPNLFDHVIGFFTRGNPVVRIGIVVLFFGVSFLLKYAAEQNLVPTELRLSAVVLAALVVLVLGWRLRARSGNYGLVLQGGAIGVLYLTVFAAAKLYQLLPPGFALITMVALVTLSGVLAVLQDARALAVFGSAGGFLAPVLTSTGGGSHVMLFSYFALLNVGIFGIAWFRAWRELNVLGFLFTFVIGASWGYQFYRPELFASTEPFLLLFFLLYVAIAVLFAARQPPQLKGYVDGTLVFGVPLVGFGLQTGLVSDFEFGLAYSALALALFYLVLASQLWRRAAPGLRLITEAFLALGVVFGSLAIPLALDGRWTAAAWAMEGAALIWIGVRQQRHLARAFGVLLQLGAGSAFLLALDDSAGLMPIWNGIFLGGFIISVAGMFSAWYLQRHRSLLSGKAQLLSPMLLGWGLLWWLGSGAREIDAYLYGTNLTNAMILLLAGSAVAMAWLAQRIEWAELRYPPLGLLPLLGLLLVYELESYVHAHAFAGWGWLVWMLALAANYHLLWRLETHWPPLLTMFWHALGLWLLVLLLSWELDWAIRQMLPGAETWRTIAWAVVPGMVMAVLMKWGLALRWPVRQHAHAYLGLGLAPIALYLFVWLLGACLRHGAADPLPYVALINPLDLAQIFVLLLLACWLLWLRNSDVPTKYRPPAELLYGALALGGFAWLNAAVARAVHFWGGVDFTVAALSDSVLFQASASILWTLTALLVMVVATRQARRPIWFAGAALLAAAVIKLFIVDLSGIGTMARIVSFLVVGGLMLVIGYFSPLPPRTQEEATA